MSTILCSMSSLQNKGGKTQIRNAFNKIEGVNRAGVNLVTGSMQVRYNEPATEMELKNCIENTGFRIEYEQEVIMADNEGKSTENEKRQDGEFRSKDVKHDPSAGSARAVLGLREPEQTDDRHLSI